MRGDREYTERARLAFERLELGPDDELIVADNTPGNLAARVFDGLATVVHADAEPSSYYARNAGAAVASGEWLLFVDADCIPQPDLIDRYFAAPIPADCGAVAGGIAGDAGQRSLLARYARDRNFLDQTEGMHGSGGVAAATGNLLVRRRTFDDLDGFAEGIRSAGDVDFCWRMRDRAWTLQQRPEAMVSHRHREDLISFLAMIARYGAGSRWLNDRHPGVAPRWPLIAGLAGSARDVAANLLRGRVEPAAFRALDGLGLVAHNVGYRSSNTSGPIWRRARPDAEAEKNVRGVAADN